MTRTQAAEQNSAPAPSAALRRELSLVLLLAGAAYSLTPMCSPQIALGLGIVMALLSLVPQGIPTQDLARLLIQVAVVLLGFMMDLRAVLQAGAAGLLLAAAAIGSVIALGWLLSRLLRVQREVSSLITTGTAICGGSAIAALGSAIRASPSSMAVAMATVFVLNGAALYLFPWLGSELRLSAREFGAWAGIAIHDVSSVMGAAALFDEKHGTTEATAMALVVKLCRVVWLVPVVMALAWFGQRESTGASVRRGLAVPWFVLLFLLAALLHTYWPEVRDQGPKIVATAKAQLRLALFLIGTGLSVHALRTVGWRALLQGVILWVFLGAAALAVVVTVL